MKLKKLIPMLNVSNIENSLAFYNKALGFEAETPPDLIKEWRWATIKSDNIELMLSESSSDLVLEKGIDPHKKTSWPAIYYFYPDNINSLYQHVCQSGFNPTSLETTFYGMTEFSLQDPDGHLLSFGEDAQNQ